MAAARSSCEKATLLAISLSVSLILILALEGLLVRAVFTVLRVRDNILLV